LNRLKEVYVFIGPPGSGKGTLSNLCVTELGWVQLSTGNLCRKHITEQTEIGKQIDFALKSGKLVSDDLIIQLVNDWFSQVITQVEAVILDGYPRTKHQAEALNRFINDFKGRLQVKVVRFSLDDDIIINRLGSRYTCANKNCQAVYSMVEGSELAPKNPNTCDKCAGSLVRRADDAFDSIKERLAIYHKHENDLLQFYRSLGYSVIDFNVDKNLNMVFDEFKQLANIAS